MKKTIFTALVLSASIGTAMQFVWAQGKAGEPSATQAGRDKHGKAYISSENIREAERVLKQQQGVDPGIVDGIMDQQTVNAIRAFQQAHNLRVTGVLNSHTVDRLAKAGAKFSGDFAQR